MRLALGATAIAALLIGVFDAPGFPVAVGAVVACAVVWWRGTNGG